MYWRSQPAVNQTILQLSINITGPILFHQKYSEVKILLEDTPRETRSRDHD